MLKKYKHLTKIYGLKYIPIRVLKFKRSKWTRLRLLLAKRLTIAARLRERRLSSRKQVKLVRFPLGFRKVSSLANSYKELRSKKKKSSFSLKKNKFKLQNKFKVFVQKGKFSYLARLTKDKSQSKLKLKHLLNLTASSLQKRSCKDRDLYIKKIYEDFFRIHGIVSSFYFFNRFRSVTDQMKRGLVLLNDDKIGTFSSLKRGDVIKIDSKALKLKKNIKIFPSKYNLPSHLEADIYSQTIVILKDQELTSQEDYHLMSLEYINAQKI